MKLIVALMLLASVAHAEVLLKDVGVIGLASHDMFTWDKKQELNLENGRLDLTTIFEYEGGKRWKQGGNPKNAENAPVYTVTMTLVNHYDSLLKAGHTEENARKRTVKLFHGMVKDSFQRLVGMSFPVEGLDEGVTNTEQAAMRGLHDILPGKVQLFDRMGRSELDVTNFLFAKTFLNEKEMNQVIAYYNGDYDEEYKKINIPFSRKTINLKEVDGEFINKYSPYKQAEMLQDLALLGKGQITVFDVSWMRHLEELFMKGICPVGNRWMPEVTCYSKRN
ncbi:hypothetical protein [Peredibacter starrii]|uniref:Uncharacterized protein n=1 Tax=Peredibacter starrii TaxID=28202 RepID=A0AAX4HLH3_9BACT|nr:hypothetical protein [Peredibacter starrii]WPU64114.1 hypothetical protein SOO65_15580 [Peredibacter starrii]